MYESNGPDVKIRGTASHVGEKYLQLARDAQSSGDPIAAENYYQHAEHYFRMIVAAQEQLRQTQPYYQPGSDMRGNMSDDGYDDDEQPVIGGEPFAPREPQQSQPYYPREQQQPQPQPQPQPQQQPQFQPRSQNFQQPNDENVERLPSFITGGQQQPPQQTPQQGQGTQGTNGFDSQADRFPLHRRRRRHRGPRDHAAPGEGDAPMPNGPRQTED